MRIWSDNLQLACAHKQFGSYMRLDNLRPACVQAPTSVQIQPLRLFKQIIWGDTAHHKKGGHYGQDGHHCHQALVTKVIMVRMGIMVIMVVMVIRTDRTDKT